MANPHFHVFFTDTNARVHHGLKTDGLENDPNVVFNPNLDGVHGVPPHYWKLDNGLVVEMSAEEKAVRDAMHETSPKDLIAITSVLTAVSLPAEAPKASLPEPVRVVSRNWFQKLIQAFLRLFSYF